MLLAVVSCPEPLSGHKRPPVKIHEIESARLRSPGAWSDCRRRERPSDVPFPGRFLRAFLPELVGREESPLGRHLLEPLGRAGPNPLPVSPREEPLEGHWRLL